MPTTATVYVDGVIMPESSDIPATTVYCSLVRVRRAIAAQAPYDNVRCIINSPGGDVDEGLGIYDFLTACGVPVTTITYGQCCSIATAIFGAGTSRLIAPNATFMVHLPHGGVKGNINDVENYAIYLRNYTNRLISFYTKLTGKATDIIANFLQAETFMTAQEAVSNGFATGIYAPVQAIAIYKIPPIIPQTNAMSTIKKTALERAFDSIRAVFNGDPATALDLSTADGTVYTFPDSTSDMAVVGDIVLVMGIAPTDGKYVLTNGQEITVVGGVVTAVDANAEPLEPALATTAVTAIAETVDVTAIQAENTALRAELETLKADKVVIARRVDAIQANMEKLLGTAVSKDVPITAPRTIATVSAKLTASDEESARAEMLAKRTVKPKK